MTDQVVRPGQVPLLDEALYLHALAVGRRAAGTSGPNPPVGCLLVRDGSVIAEGATEPVGGRHAEIVALDAAGDAARGATAIVTLEPCAHRGRTPPCTDALLAAGVPEVHVLLRDPDPVASGGLAALARAGITVVEVGRTRPDLERVAAHDLRGFLVRVVRGRPHVTLKLAQAPDGRTVPVEQRYLTGDAARRRVHELRAGSDAVLVGGATVRADDPRLDVRHVTSARQPRPVLLSTAAEVPIGARAVRDGTVVLHGQGVASARRAELEAVGARPIVVPLDPLTGGLDLASALASLLDERILTVLAEPGRRLAGALFEAGLVDTVELHVAGGAAASDIRPALAPLAPLIDGSCAVEELATGDGDLILRSESLGVPDVRSALEGAA